MKKLILILIAICLMLLTPQFSIAGDKALEPVPPPATEDLTKEDHTCDIDKKINDAVSKYAEKFVMNYKSICPHTKMDNSCLSCHVRPSWELMEPEINNNLTFPTGPDMTVDPDRQIASIFITDISSVQVEQFFEYIKWHPEIRHVVFEVHSPGGSLFDAWRIVGLMEYHKSRGITIETRVHGFAASAGFVIFVNGSKGQRFASKTSELMWHELLSFSMFKVERPSDMEDEAKVLRHLQTTCSTYLAARSNLTAKQWDEKVHKKDFWINGKQAIAFGISDGTP